MRITSKITDTKHYGDVRQGKIDYIVVQTVGNSMSAHYQIHNGETIQIIPDDYISDSVNGGKINKCGYLHGICTKYNSISICITDDISKNDKELCLKLIMTLKQRYKIKRENIVRQKDITGEINPAVWHDDDKWKRDIIDKLIEI